MKLLKVFGDINAQNIVKVSLSFSLSQLRSKIAVVDFPVSGND